MSQLFIQGLKMVDLKTAAGAAVTLAAYGSTRMEQVNAYAEFALTGIGIVVGIMTIIYTAQRMKKLKEDEDE